MSRKPKAIDLTTLDGYIGMSWENASETLKYSGHMLAFGDDPFAKEVVKTYISDGPEAGMAALVSALFLKKHGAADTAEAGMKIYEKIAKELGNASLSHRVSNMSYMVFFASRGGRREYEWPMAYPFEDVQRRAGLANIMLAMGMIELSKTGSTCDYVAACGISRFFEESDKLRKLKKAV